MVAANVSPTHLRSVGVKRSHREENSQLYYAIPAGDTLL